MFKKFVSKSCADFGKFKITDHDVATYVKKHMRFIDRFNVEKVVAAAFVVFTIVENNDGKFDNTWKGKFRFEDGWAKKD